MSRRIQNYSAMSYSILAALTGLGCAAYSQVDLGQALNATNLNWTAGGDVPWVVQDGITHFDDFATAAGIITHSQQSTLQTEVNGPGTLTFWWLVSSQPTSDYFSFSAKGTERARISGYPDWQQMTIYLEDGPQVLEWAYTKDASESYGGDYAILDQISYTAGATPPDFASVSGSMVVGAGSNVVLAASAYGTPPLTYQWRFNHANLLAATNDSLFLDNINPASEGTYELWVTNAYGSVLSSNIYVKVIDIAEALNATNLLWTSTNGNQPWFVQVAINRDGVAALQSGPILANQTSSLESTAEGPGTLTFWWRSWTEKDNDVLRFSIDNIEYDQTSGSTGWRQRTFYLPSGTHQLAWVYAKNGFTNAGQDTVWLDEVSFSPGGTAATIVSNPVNQAASLFSSATFQVTAIGTPPLSYQWLFEGAPVPGATNATLTLTNIQTNSAGNYGVIVSNEFGVVSYTNAKLTALYVQAWGAGKTNAGFPPNFGQCLIPASATNIVAIAAGGVHSVGLNAQGKVIPWGSSSSGLTNVPTSASNVIAIAAGDQHTLVLRSNGTAVAWGFGVYGQTTVPSSASNVISIAAGWHHNLALRSNGTVVAWGAGTSVGISPHFGQSILPSGLSNVVAVAAGGYHSLVLKNDGSLLAWGLNASGQTNIPAGLSNVIAIAAGASNNLALRADGTVVGWGNNAHGQTNVPAGLSKIVAITAGGNSCMALSAGNVLFCWGDNTTGQTNAPVTLTNIVSIASGRYHSMALLNDGSLSLLSQPSSRHVTNGATVQFKTQAFGLPPISYQWQWNGVDVVGATNATLLIADAQYASEGNYRVMVSNPSRTTISSNGFLNVLDLGEALNAPELNWTNNGIGFWMPATTVTHDGVAALVAGPLVFLQSPVSLQSTVTGPGTLSFWWLGTPTYSTLRFYVDGVLKSSVGGGGSWTQLSLRLSPGLHTLTWTAANTQPSSQTGTAYLDQITFTPDLFFDVTSLSTSNGAFAFRLTGLSGHGPTIIYASSNLLNWQPIYTNPPQTGSLQYIDLSITNKPLQFYRAEGQ